MLSAILPCVLLRVALCLFCRSSYPDLVDHNDIYGFPTRVHEGGVVSAAVSSASLDSTRELGRRYKLTIPEGGEQGLTVSTCTSDQAMTVKVIDASDRFQGSVEVDASTTGDCTTGGPTCYEVTCGGGDALAAAFPNSPTCDAPPINDPNRAIDPEPDYCSPMGTTHEVRCCNDDVSGFSTGRALGSGRIYLRVSLCKFLVDHYLTCWLLPIRAGASRGPANDGSNHR